MATPRTAGTRRADRRAELASAMEAAMERLLSEGASYTELSVDELCTASGVSRSTFYSYWEDKGHLLREVTADRLGEMGAIAEEWWSRGPAITFEELRAVAGRMAATYREHDVLFAAVSDTAVWDPSVRELFDSMIEGFIAEITAMIEAEQKANPGSPRAPARETAAFVTWMCVHGYYQMVRGANERQIDRIADAQAEIVWRAVHGRELPDRRSARVQGR